MTAPGRARFVDASIVDAATWVIGEAVARVAAGQSGGMGPVGEPARLPRRRRPADHRSPPPSRARGRRCARRSNGPISPTGWPPRPTGRPRSPTSWPAIFATRPAAEWVARLAGRRRAVGPVQHRRGPARRPARAGPRVDRRARRRRRRPGCCARPCGSATPTGREEPFARRPAARRWASTPTPRSRPPASPPTRSPRCTTTARSEPTTTGAAACRTRSISPGTARS